MRSSVCFTARNFAGGAIAFCIVSMTLLTGGCSEAPKLAKHPAPAPSQSEEAKNAPADEAPALPGAAQSERADEGAFSAGSGSARRYRSAKPPDASEADASPPDPVGGGAPPPSEMGRAAPPPAAEEHAAEAEEPAPEGRAAEAPAAAPPPPPPSPAPVTAAKPPKEYDVVPVFYGTDRATTPDPNRLQFGSDRGHVLQLGRALITVPLAHKVPNIERPWVIEIPYFKVKVYEEKEDPNKHFTVQEIKSLTEEQMLALVKERLAKSSTFKDHAFVFIHGFNTSFDCALYRTAQIAYDLKFDGVPFVYSWPSGGAVASYTYDRGSVEQAEPLLADFLKLVVEKSGAKSISLIAHSMGNELLLRVLERLRPKVPKGVVISQVILAAPDVDRDKFNIIAREITSYAKGVTLYAASNDRALGYSARFWGGPRAGDVPDSIGPLIIPGVDTIDVTAVSTDALGLNHSGYAENPALLKDVKALVEYGVRPPDKRMTDLIIMQTEAGGTFWKFPDAPPAPQ